MAPAVNEARWLADGRRGSAGTIVVVVVAVLLPSVLVGGTGPWVDAALPA